jgi:hypothetical protein
MNSRTKGNDTLRQKLKVFLDTIPSGKEITINHLSSELQKTDRRYAISSLRVSSILKEFDTSIKWVRDNIWIKL